MNFFGRFPIHVSLIKKRFVTSPNRTDPCKVVKSDMTNGNLQCVHVNRVFMQDVEIRINAIPIGVGTTKKHWQR